MVHYWHFPEISEKKMKESLGIDGAPTKPRSEHSRIHLHCHCCDNYLGGTQSNRYASSLSRTNFIGTFYKY